jgi:hypothetical protein
MNYYFILFLVMVIPTIVGWCYQLLAATRGDLLLAHLGGGS